MRPSHYYRDLNDQRLTYQDLPLVDPIEYPSLTVWYAAAAIGVCFLVFL